MNERRKSTNDPRTETADRLSPFRRESIRDLGLGLGCLWVVIDERRWLPRLVGEIKKLEKESPTTLRHRAMDFLTERRSDELSWLIESMSSPEIPADEKAWFALIVVAFASAEQWKAKELFGDEPGEV